MAYYKIKQINNNVEFSFPLKNMLLHIPKGDIKKLLWVLGIGRVNSGLVSEKKVIMGTCLCY